MEKVVPASIFMPGGTSSSIGPDHANHYKVGSAVMELRGSIGGLTAKSDTVISVKSTSGSHSSSDILHILLVSSQILRVVWPYVETVSHMY